MKISAVIFKGASDDANTYQLAIDTYNGKPTVKVLRNFKGDQERQDQVPSGWYVEQVLDLPSLCIDGGQKWFVYPTTEAWADIKSLL